MRAPRPPISPQARMKPRMERSFSLLDELSGPRLRLLAYIILEEEEKQITRHKTPCLRDAFLTFNCVWLNDLKKKSIHSSSISQARSNEGKSSWIDQKKSFIFRLPLPLSFSLSLSFLTACLSFLLLIELLLLCSWAIVIFYLDFLSLALGVHSFSSALWSSFKLFCNWCFLSGAIAVSIYARKQKNLLFFLMRKCFVFLSVAPLLLLHFSWLIQLMITSSTHTSIHDVQRNGWCRALRLVR